MGSNTKGKDGGGPSGVKKEDEEEEQDMRFVAPELLLGSSNVNSHRPYQPTPSPLGIQQPHALLQDGYVESVLHERLKRVKITWNHAGTDVSVAGSWDNWERREPLQRVGQTLVIVKTLPIGIYHYRFIVDGYLIYAPEFPSACDDSGYAYNILDLQDYIPETLARLSDMEDPSSPPWSYDNVLLNDDEFGKPPPELPPQMPVTIREEASSSTRESGLLPRPSHLELNHLYIHKTDRDEFVALRSTHKFEHKYVTMVLYKSLRRER